MPKTKNKKAPFVVVSGPSGSGKTTLCRMIAKDNDWYYSISHTTRPQRAKEVNGRDYYFVGSGEFRDLVASGEFLEWAQVYDNNYGTSKRIIESKLAQGQGVVVDVDTQGASHIKKLYPEAVLIFIKTGTPEMLRQRLVLRGRDGQQEIDKRMKNAVTELEHVSEYDYVVVNDDLQQANSAIRAIINKIKK